MIENFTDMPRSCFQFFNSLFHLQSFCTSKSNNFTLVDFFFHQAINYTLRSNMSGLFVRITSLNVSVEFKMRVGSLFKHSFHAPLPDLLESCILSDQTSFYQNSRHNVLLRFVSPELPTLLKHVARPPIYSSNSHQWLLVVYRFQSREDICF